MVAAGRETRKLKVAINAPAQVEPEKRMVAKIKVDNLGGKKAMVTVSAVDVGTSISPFPKHQIRLISSSANIASAQNSSDLHGVDQSVLISGRQTNGGWTGKRDTKSTPEAGSW